MKKFFLFFFLVILILVGLVGALYFNMPKIATFILSKDFQVPVSVKEVKLKKGELSLINFQIDNPKKSKSKKAAFIETTKIEATLKGLFSKRMTINTISLKNIKLNIELYGSDVSKNNWSKILKKQPKKEKTRPYLIKLLVLEKIKVSLYKKDGTMQTFPVIDRLEFKNITEETGFPINQIEKAIMDAVLRSIYKQYGLKTLLDALHPKNLIPNIIKPLLRKP
jgi:hypothetical protein